jgi:hypothetical protein
VTEERLGMNLIAPSKIYVCTACSCSLLDEHRPHPPKFSIANGNFVGLLPEKFNEVTYVETKLLSLVTMKMETGVTRGGQSTILKEHVQVHDANPSKIVKHLPRTLNGAQEESLDDASFDVILAGRFTSAQDLLSRKRHKISAERLRSFFSFLKAQNICYSGDDEVDLNETTVERLLDWTDHVSQDISHERADMDDEKSEAEKPVDLSDEMTSDRCSTRTVPFCSPLCTYFDVPPSLFPAQFLRLLALEKETKRANKPKNQKRKGIFIKKKPHHESI